MKKFSESQVDMKIAHIAVWTANSEFLRDFYIENFGCIAGRKYTNSNTGFCSYFLEFTSGARLEIMTKPGLSSSDKTGTGYAHIAISLGTEDKVREVTEKLRHNGVKITSEPRKTGDGYYESVILDPDGNIIELTV
jgi:lactoylglutathione lyase